VFDKEFFATSLPVAIGHYTAGSPAASPEVRLHEPGHLDPARPSAAPGAPPAPASPTSGQPPGSPPPHRPLRRVRPESLVLLGLVGSMLLGERACTARALYRDP
jgi:hypothetical protein